MFCGEKQIAQHGFSRGNFGRRAALAFDGATAGAEVPPKEIESINSRGKNVSLETKFTDIDHHWAYNDIVSLEAIGMWEDLTDEFGPKKTVTGAELIFALDKIFGFRGADLVSILNWRSAE